MKAILSVLMMVLVAMISCTPEQLKSPPSVGTTKVELSASSLVATGQIISDGGAAITLHGFYLSKSATGSANDLKTAHTGNASTFTDSFGNLEAGTTYYVKAYAVNSEGTSYGTALSVSTVANTLAVIETSALSNITSTTATGGGNVTADGGANITAKGVCWSTSANPTIADAKTADGSGTGAFTSAITGLTPGTTYYVRAYAINSVGTSYGSQVTLSAMAILPNITTSSLSNITSTTATGGGNVTADGGANITAKGVCWSTNANPTIADTKTMDGAGTGTFTSTITGLTPGTTYYVRAYATNVAGTSYGTQVTLSATAILPSVSTASLSNVTSTTATCGGNVTNDGGANVIARGVCWGTLANPTIADAKTTDGTGTGNFTSTISGLTPGTTYYVRAYAINSVGTAYGSQVTLSSTAILPSVTTASLSAITTSSAVCGGNVTADGGANVTSRGVCWSTSANPTIADAKTTDGSGAGAFSSSITGLTVSTTYYVRAYATSSVGTSYGAQITLLTLTPPAVLPTVTTSSLSAITTTSANGGGNVTNDGGASITARGICWSTSANPTIANSKTSDGSGAGSFASSISGLTPGTTYYVRAYAINSAGTAYGAQMTLVTLTPAPVLPTLTTASASAIIATAAVSGGNITNDGGASITVRGVCWSTTSGPTTANSKTSDGLGAGSFTSSITGLTASTTYYVRAYATNSVGTAYGNETSFTTTAPLVLPTLTTNTVTSITATSAVCGGNITSDGGASVIARGVCWSTNPIPTIADSKTANGTGTGAFTSSITGLTAGTTYYVTAYATTSVGTKYGGVLSFVATAPAALATVTTNTLSYIGTTTATGRGEVVSDGGSPVTERGVCWSEGALSVPTIANAKTVDGSGVGTFSSSMTGLNAGVSYRVRAYATNGAGTAYGLAMSFMTTPVAGSIPTVTTTDITAITTTSATGGGNVTNDGGSVVMYRGVCWGISPNPTVSNYKTTNGSGTGAFTSSLSPLNPGTTYYARAYATNNAGTGYGSQVTFTTGIDAGTVVDVDGNVYHTVKIGNQTWMVENLRTTRFRNGSSIWQATNDASWAANTNNGPAYCWYNNTVSGSIGALYNWYAATDPNIAPVGWHVPTKAEWDELINYLGGASVAGGKLKSTSSTWQAPNTGATNSSGFTALPAGARGDRAEGVGKFGDYGTDAAFWTTDELGAGAQNGGVAYYTSYNITSTQVDVFFKAFGYSIRCIKN